MILYFLTQKSMSLLILWLVTALAVLVGAYILPGVQVDNFVTALVAAIVLGLVNLVVKPLVLLVTLPLNILTLGLFTFVVSALMILLVDWLVPGFAVSNFWYALLLALIVALITSLLTEK